MRRRAFIAMLGGAAAWPLVARAQQPMPMIGYLSARSSDAEAPLRVPFLKALETSGFVVGRNLAIEYRASPALLARRLWSADGKSGQGRDRDCSYRLC